MTGLKVKIEVTENDSEATARFQRNAFSSDAPDPRVAALQTPAYYHWKYNTPFGQATVGRVLLDGSTVSHLAAIPTILSDGREVTRAWQLCDIATHPGHRGAGYFRCLLGEWLGTLPERDLVYCFPNARSLPILLASGFSARRRASTLGCAGPCTSTRVKQLRDRLLLRRPSVSLRQKSTPMGMSYPRGSTKHTSPGASLCARTWSICA